MMGEKGWAEATWSSDCPAGPGFPTAPSPGVAKVLGNAAAVAIPCHPGGWILSYLTAPPVSSLIHMDKVGTSSRKRNHLET